jgi:hypothetical protein
MTQTQSYAKKMINSRLDFMEYTIEQYEMGVLSIDSTESLQTTSSQSNSTTEDMTLLSSTSDRTNFTIPSDADNLSTNSERKRPFLRTPLLSKLKDKASRSDDGGENEVMTIHYNETAGAYFLFRRRKKNSSEVNGTINGSNSKQGDMTLLSSASDWTNFTTPLDADVENSLTNSGRPICPAPYNPVKTDYVAGQIVEVKNGYVFQCQKEREYAEYCNYPTFDEVLVIAMGVNETELADLWLNAWVLVGECEGVSRPSSMPVSKPSSSTTVDVSSTLEPTFQREQRSYAPTVAPSFSPSFSPTLNPSNKATLRPSTKSPTESPESPSASPTQSPSYSPSTWSPTYYNHPISPPCTPSETRVRIELQTDGFPKDTSWVFKRVRTKDQRNDGVFWRSKAYVEKQSLDVREVCLESGVYEFVLTDRYGDGLLGNGYYKISASGGNDESWQLVVAGAQFAAKQVRHTFAARDDGQFELVCEYPQRKITLDILTDAFGEDVSWQFQDENGVIIAKNEHTYGRKEHDSRDLCLEDKSIYKFVVFDAYKDGLCCRFGNGHYKILSYNNDLFNDENITDAGGVAILHGGMFFESNITHTINTTQAARTTRDIDWLDAHNLRRKKYHTLYETEFVPLQWSEGLAAEAKVWADSLLDSCGKGMFHDPTRIYGENAAGNTGGGSWGTQREPDQILARFVEYELDDPWPHNGHLTQVLWRVSYRTDLCLFIRARLTEIELL